MVRNQKTGNGSKPKLEIGIYYELYSDLVLAGVGNQIDKWTMNDMSIFWLKLQNKQAVDRYIANPPTDTKGKALKFNYPY